jgi:oligopeptide/dipeptide ABC transporter ATP-binding protein
VKRKAGVKGELEGSVALAYLRALLEVIHGTGLSGLAVVLDEGDRLTQQRAPERQKSWDVLRHLLDDTAANRFPGLYLVLTGTRELFDGKKGICEYGALHQRLGVEFREGEPDDLHQKQIRLPSFDKAAIEEPAVEEPVAPLSTRGIKRPRLPVIEGLVPDLLALPPGCRFADRCPMVIEECRQAEPELAEIEPGHLARCIRAHEV